MQKKKSSELPDDLVPVGFVTGAYGIRGIIRVKPYSSDASALLHAKQWWLEPDFKNIHIDSVAWHGEVLVAKIKGVNDRTIAESFKGSVINISRNDFPDLDKDEYYWVDLIGMRVENLQGEVLGKVVGLLDNSVHPILRVSPTEDVSAKNKERLIPFVDNFIKTVDKNNALITVDWGLVFNN